MHNSFDIHRLSSSFIVTHHMSEMAGAHAACLYADAPTGLFKEEVF
jgi:hypothetical protein